jgi:hypothetical protein
MAGRSSAKTTVLYDRHKDEVSVGEVEKIGIQYALGLLDKHRREAGKRRKALNAGEQGD